MSLVAPALDRTRLWSCCSFWCDGASHCSAARRISLCLFARRRSFACKLALFNRAFDVQALVLLSPRATADTIRKTTGCASSGALAIASLAVLEAVALAGPDGYSPRGSPWDGRNLDLWLFRQKPGNLPLCPRARWFMLLSRAQVPQRNRARHAVVGSARTGGTSLGGLIGVARAMEGRLRNRLTVLERNRIPRRLDGSRRVSSGSRKYSICVPRIG